MIHKRANSYSVLILLTFFIASKKDSFHKNRAQSRVYKWYYSSAPLKALRPILWLVRQVFNRSQIIRALFSSRWLNIYRKTLLFKIPIPCFCIFLGQSCIFRLFKDIYRVCLYSCWFQSVFSVLEHIWMDSENSGFWLVNDEKFWNQI